MNEMQDSGGILQMLMSLLSPQSAEAASGPSDPMAQAMKISQMRNQQQMQQQRQALQQQQMQMQQEKLASQQAKQAPAGGGGLAEKIQEILGGNQAAGGLPGDVLQGGPNAPITFGKNPRTGTWTFNNLGWVNAPTPYANDIPEWAVSGRAGKVAESLSGGEARQQVDTAKKAEQTSKTGVSPERLAQGAQLASMLKGIVPAETINLIFRSTFPELAEQKTKEAKDVAKARSEVTLERQKTMADFNAAIAKQKEKDKPLPEAVQKQLSFGDELQRQADSISKFIDDGSFEQFIGPVAGRSYEYRRQVPGMVTEQETTLRRALAQLRDVNLYMRSGVAINEQEAKRLAEELPNENDDPSVFRTKYENYQKELAAMVRTRRKLATMSRGDVEKLGDQPIAGGQSGAAPGGSAKLASKEDVSNAMKQSGGDRRKALEFLKSQGFTGAQ